MQKQSSSSSSLLDLVVGSSLDVVICHEGNLSPALQRYCQDATPDLPLKFVDVGEVFRNFKDIDGPQCPKNSMIVMMFFLGLDVLLLVPVL